MGVHGEWWHLPSAGADLEDDTDVLESADSQSLDTDANTGKAVSQG